MNTDNQLPPLPTPKFTETIRGVPCITVTEHEHLMRAYALQANAILALSVPDDVVRDAIAAVREQYRGTDWGKAAECICDAIDAAMLAAKEGTNGEIN